MFHAWEIWYEYKKKVFFKYTESHQPTIGMYLHYAKLSREICQRISTYTVKVQPKYLIILL